MSGIFGVYHPGGPPVDRPLLERMSAALAHRGPDGSGLWVNGTVGLGHCMLRTTPESIGETQPLVGETGDLVLVMDGRVDNREELRRDLLGKGAHLCDDTDAEIVLRAYETWGEACPARIIGEFAFALWDARRRSLFLARDALGLRPLYYHWSPGGRFVFASEFQPFFQHPGVPRRPNLPLIGYYLLNRYDEREETLYDTIRRVPSSHRLLCGPGGPALSRYWDVDPEKRVRFRTDGEYAECFLAILRESVRCRLRSHGGVAVGLSGGLDSSSIACVAQELCTRGEAGNGGVEVISMLFPGFPCDERRYIEEVVRSTGAKSTTLDYDDDLSADRFEDGSLYPDVPYDPVLIRFSRIYREASRRGIRVFLDGIGGDEVLASGFDHLTDLMKAGHFANLVRQLRFDSTLFDVTPFTLFKNYCLRPLVPESIRRGLRPLAAMMRKRVEPVFLSAGFRSRVLHRETTRPGNGFPRFPTRSQQNIYGVLFQGWNAILSTEISELTRSRFSLETRRPYLDRRLVEFALAIPEDQRWRRDESKFVLRRALQGIVPETVLRRRRKAEFSAPYVRYLARDRSSQVEELFGQSALASLGVLDSKRFVEVLRSYRGHPAPYLTGMITFILGLEIWLGSVMNARSR